MTRARLSDLALVAGLAGYAVLALVRDVRGMYAWDLAARRVPRTRVLSRAEAEHRGLTAAGGHARPFPTHIAIDVGAGALERHLVALERARRSVGFGGGVR